MSDTPKEDVRKYEALRVGLGIEHIEGKMSDLELQLKSVISELGNTNQVVNQLVQALNQANPSSPGPATTQPVQTVQSIGQIDPMTKMQLINQLATGLAELVKAWKGTPSLQQTDPMSSLGKQLVTDLVRATVDDIQQRVYNIRKLPPPDILRTAISPEHSL